MTGDFLVTHLSCLHYIVLLLFTLYYQMTARGTAKGYNEDLYEFLCLEAVAVKS